VRRTTLATIAPGVLVAATGVGAGDLITAAFTGHQLGVTVAWAVLAGAGLKFVLSEGLARWQLATGDTPLESVARHAGRGVLVALLVYMVAWSFFVGAALMGACGVTAHAVLGGTDARTGKIAYGIATSALGVVLVRGGGYALFQRVMKACIGIMFAIVVLTGIVVLVQDWPTIVAQLGTHRQPVLGGTGLAWTVALIGGVGGTVTILSYGYWIREEGRTSLDALADCRTDLAIGYAMTALFGVAMVVIGSTIAIEGEGTGVILAVADQLQSRLGPAGRWAFLVGAWGTVACSLLGVWQSVPYLFADAWTQLRRTDDARRAVDVASRPYRLALYALATIPALGLFRQFATMQRWYAIVGAAFMPALALALLAVGTRALRGRPGRHGPLARTGYVVVLAFFVLAAALELRDRLAR
jgi:Mn2+/Fe2+ NRAMP family transporter